MSRIVIVTRVGKNREEVIAGFNKELFLALKPPLLPMKLEKFDGIKEGDKVALKIWTGKWQEWVNIITSSYSNPLEIGFIDEGEKLPSFLKKWRHHHRIVDRKKLTLILDDIQYSTGNVVFDILIYPFLFMTFWWRKFTYRKFFGKRRTK